MTARCSRLGFARRHTACPLTLLRTPQHIHTGQRAVYLSCLIGIAPPPPRASAAGQAPNGRCAVLPRQAGAACRAREG
eukprot:364197-Chlamydomonas_euryale.AAC.26